MTEDTAGTQYLPRPETVTAEYMRDVLDEYYAKKWNANADTVAAVSSWRNWPLVVRMPDLKQDFTVLIDDGVVQKVDVGLPERPRILTVMLADTMQRIYYEETTSAIEAISGRIKIRGNEVERRRLLAAISFLTW
ncbi:hypothetical protein PSU4_26410 [Pseudonocardia sulfidoxydans NBRC 16205]|uniref:SCP2 domain-containing protein n=1 Tax=Pseudonocardia sulfidoxydans NBRC 16205 TaxID=1223511 RepID=A0A511DGP5_9PSEU|nr:hypothetical protein [Pseudonocardia sulfidoxydans]GEL23687.1 hypothetical protein PSU4_26410 [Pseudonocardia sulfidoxydans NBRC 16205]